MSEIVRGAALPSAQGPPVYDVIAPQAGELYDLTFLDEYVLGVSCHWVIDPATKKGRSRLCYAHEGDCPYHDQRALWLGWLGVINHSRRRREILRMGAESARALATALGKGNKPRGKRYNVSRLKASPTAQLVFDLSQFDPQTPLPQPHVLAPTVCLVLGCEAIPDYTFSMADIREGGRQ